MTAHSVFLLGDSHGQRRVHGVSKSRSTTEGLSTLPRRGMGYFLCSNACHTRRVSDELWSFYVLPNSLVGQAKDVFPAIDRFTN